MKRLHFKLFLFSSCLIGATQVTAQNTRSIENSQPTDFTQHPFFNFTDPAFTFHNALFIDISG